MKVLLIQPSNNMEELLGGGKVFVHSTEPLGLLYIAAVLEEAGIEVLDAFVSVLRLLDNHPENQKESEKNCIDNGKGLFFSENRRAVDAAINLITRNFYSFFGEIEGHDAVVLDFDI